MTQGMGPGELANALAALPVRIDSAGVEQTRVALHDYPGGLRPSSLIRISGGGRDGLGENVAFSEAEHAQFADFAESWLRACSTQVSELSVHTAAVLGAFGALYQRAALEAALIDLALRQARLGLCDLTGVRERALRFVVSFSAEDPSAAIRDLRASGFSGDLKIDVDPRWDLATLEAMSREPGVAIVDFKGRGDLALVEWLATRMPGALLEDPPGNLDGLDALGRNMRISRDAPLRDALAVAKASVRAEAVNLKAPRMGGPLELLRGLELARSSSAYLGGMFEVGVGRSQAQQIAALYCHEAPNDLAPNVPSAERASSPRTNSPLLVRFDEPGFGQR